jgi:hypothetical protein
MQEVVGSLLERRSRSPRSPRASAQVARTALSPRPSRTSLSPRRVREGVVARLTGESLDTVRTVAQLMDVAQEMRVGKAALKHASTAFPPVPVPLPVPVVDMDPWEDSASTMPAVTVAVVTQPFAPQGWASGTAPVLARWSGGQGRPFQVGQERCWFV